MALQRKLMKHFIVFLALLSLASLLVVTGYNDKVTYDLKLVHLNANWLYETTEGLPEKVAINNDMVNSPEKRKQHIHTVAKYLITTKADLIHLAEVQDHRVLDTITKQLNKGLPKGSPMYKYYLVKDFAFESEKIIYQHVAFISRLPIIGSPTRSLSLMPGIYLPFFKHIVAKFELPDGRTLFAAGVHLDNQQLYKGRHFLEMDKALKELERIGANADNEDHVVAILGDFNEVLPLDRDVSTNACDYTIKSHFKLINPVQYAMTQEMNPSVKQSHDKGLIDSILVSENFAASNEATPVVKGHTWAMAYDTVGLSDHSPVELTFNVNVPKVVVQEENSVLEQIPSESNFPDASTQNSEMGITLSTEKPEVQSKVATLEEISFESEKIETVTEPSVKQPPNRKSKAQENPFNRFDSLTSNSETSIESANTIETATKPSVRQSLNRKSKKSKAQKKRLAQSDRLSFSWWCNISITVIFMTGMIMLIAHLVLSLWSSLVSAVLY